MNYKELATLIDAGKDEEILNALKGEPEQAVIALMDMQDTPHKQYLVNLLEPFDTNGSLDDLQDYILSSFIGPFPENNDDQSAWDAFYAEGSPFRTYETNLYKKYLPKMLGDGKRLTDDDVTDYINNNYEGPFPENNDDQSAWDEFYAEGSPYWSYSDAMHKLLDQYVDKPELKDVNGDGDTDVATADTNGNGEKDTAVVAGDNAKEEKDAVKAAKEDLGLDGEDDTSTGKKKKELDDEETTVSDKKQKDTCSDSRQKNILSALSELRF